MTMDANDKLREARRRIDALREQLRTSVAQEREACAKLAEEWAKHYPLSIFPEEGPPQTFDNASARMGRHAAKMIAQEIRKRGTR